MRGFIGAMGALNYSYAIQALQLGDAVAIVSIYPILTAFVARFFLNEHLTIKHIIGLVLSAVGVALIAQPSFIFKNFDNNHNNSQSNHSDTDSVTSYDTYDSQNDSINTNDDSSDSSEYSTNATIGYMCAFGSSICGAFIFVFIRGAKDANHMFLVLSHGIFSIIESIIVCFIIPSQNFEFSGIFDHVTDMFGWLVIIGLGSFGFLGQYTQNKAGQMIPAGIASLLRSSDIIWGYVWEIIIFNEVPNLFDICGALSILIAIILVSWEKLMIISNKYKNSKNNNSNKNGISKSVASNVLESVKMRKYRNRKGYDKLKLSDSSLMSISYSDGGDGNENDLVENDLDVDNEMKDEIESDDVVDGVIDENADGSAVGVSPSADSSTVSL